MAKNGVAGIGFAAFAVVCCAALPLLAATGSTLALGSVVGLGAGVAAAAALIGMVVVRAGRRRHARPASPRSRTASPSRSSTAGKRCGSAVVPAASRSSAPDRMN